MVDYEDLNSAIIPFVEEAGLLGEQNWKGPIGLTRSADMDADVGLSAAHVYTQADASDSVAFPPANTAVMQATGTWAEIPGMAVEFTSTGEALYVLASLQMSTNTSLTATANLVWAKFGIAVDGGTHPILVVGDQDTGAEGPAMEIGVSGYGQGVDIEGSVPVAPGRHRVAVVAWVDQVEDLTTTLTVQVLNRELLVLELW